MFYYEMDRQELLYCGNKNTNKLRHFLRFL